nr:hypothetical protein [Tanacetum cinerariifolium]
MSMDDLYNNLKVYEPEVEGMSSSSSSTQNTAFVSSSNKNTSSTNEAVNTAHAVNIAHGVSTARTQVNAAYSTNIDNLPLGSCDGLGGYDWSDQAEEGPNYALMAFSSSSSDSKEISCLQHLTCPTGLDEFVNESVVENYKAMSSEEEPKGNLQMDLQDQGVIDSGCSRHMTWNMSNLTDYKEIYGGYVAFGRNPKGGKITKKCTMKTVLLRVPRKYNMYNVDLKNIVPKGGLTYLFEKATSDESKLWHRRLGHLNFKTMNKLVKGNLVRENSFNLPLHLLHMDLFGPSFVEILKKKMYCLVVTNDYSRIKNLVDHKVKVIRCDNGTEFKNREMNQFCEMKGILRQFSVAKTPQRNRVAERRNNTLIKAARTMFSESTPNVVGSGLHWLFDINALIRTIKYKPIVAGTQSNGFADLKSSYDDGSKPASDDEKKVDEDPRKESKCKDQEKEYIVNSTNNVNTTDNVYTVSLTVNVAGINEVNAVGGKISIKLPFDPKMSAWQDNSIFDFLSNDEDDGAVADMNNLDTTIQIEEEMYVCQPPGFKDLDFLNRVYKVEKALYGLHQALKAWYKTLSTYLLDNRFQRGKIDKTLFIKRHKDEFYGRTYILLGIIKVKTASTSIETQKPLLKDKDDEEVDVHMYRSMIGSLMYLTSSRPNIMFAVCACAGYQVNPKVSHLYAIKRIFRVTWMGGFHLFADVAKYGRTNNRLEERYGDIKPNEDLDGMKHSIFAKVKDLSVITDLLKYMSSEGFVDVGLRYVGGRWVWLEFDSTDQVESVKNSKGGLWGCSVFTDMVNDRPLSHGKVCVLTESLHHVLESFKVSYRNRSYCITATEFAYWAPNIESIEDKSMTDSLERNDDEGPSLDGGLEHEEPLDNTSIPEVVEDLSSLDRSSYKAERLAHHNNGLDDLDISLRNRLLHQDKCRVRPVKAAVNDSSIVSSSMPPGTVLNLAEESCSTWLDYVGLLITDELDSEKR